APSEDETPERGFQQVRACLRGLPQTTRSGSSPGRSKGRPGAVSGRVAAAIFREVSNSDPVSKVSAMASGADLIRKIKEQIEEVDPKEVHDLRQNGNGAVLLDVREQHEFDESHIPGAVHVPRGHLESRIEGNVPDHSQRVIIYCASGNRSALAAHTMKELLGYE